MKYVDPNGEFIWIAAAIVLIAIVVSSCSGPQHKPMNDASIYSGWANHLARGTHGIDLISADTRVFATHDGKIQYFDTGNTGYGFHAVITYEKDGYTYTEILGHLERPNNSAELVAQGKKDIQAGVQIGTMGNTGNCWTTNGDPNVPPGHPSAPVTDAERAQGRGKHLHYEIRRKQNDKETQYVEPTI